MNDKQGKTPTVMELEKMFEGFYNKHGKFSAGFRRQYNNMSEEGKKRVDAELKNRGLAMPPPSRVHKKSDDLPAVKKSRVEWTEEEWQFVTDTVHELRRQHPAPALTVLVDQAVKKLPEDRRRKLVAASMRPLIERLRAKGQEQPQTKEDFIKTLDTDDILTHFKDKVILALPREEIVRRFKGAVLSSLTEDDLPQIRTLLEHLPSKDIYESFSQEVLEHITPAEAANSFETADLLDSIPFSEIVGFVAKSWAESLSNFSLLGDLLQKIPHQEKTPRAPTLPKPAARPQKLRVTIVGAKANQQQIINSRIGYRFQLNFVSRNHAMTIPEGQDAIVCWARFINHSVYDQAKSKAKGKTRLFTHHGGISAMIEALEQWADSLNSD